MGWVSQLFHFSMLKNDGGPGPVPRTKDSCSAVPPYFIGSLERTIFRKFSSFLRAALHGERLASYHGKRPFKRWAIYGCMRDCRC